MKKLQILLSLILTVTAGFFVQSLRQPNESQDQPLEWRRPEADRARIDNTPASHPKRFSDEHYRTIHEKSLFHEERTESTQKDVVKVGDGETLIENELFVLKGISVWGSNKLAFIGSKEASKKTPSPTKRVIVRRPPPAPVKGKKVVPVRRPLSHKNFNAKLYKIGDAILETDYKLHEITEDDVILKSTSNTIKLPIKDIIRKDSNQ